jgi:hypothetical protein
MLHIKMPFGYSSVSLDRKFAIFTGKIRVKESLLNVTKVLSHHPQLTFIEGKNGCTIISYATMCLQTNDFLIQEINTMLANIMHARIDAKYAPKVWEPKIVEYDYEGFIKSSEPQLVGKIDLSQFVAL